MKRFDPPLSSSSSSGSETGDSSSSSQSFPGKEQPREQRSELLFSQLAAFSSEEPNDSLAAQHGRDKTRIRKALAQPCRCNKQCGRLVKFGHILAAVTLFWSLSKSGQDCLLWSMQSAQFEGAEESSHDDSTESEGSSPSSSSRSRSCRRRMNKWYIQGARVQKWILLCS